MGKVMMLGRFRAFCAALVAAGTLLSSSRAKAEEAPAAETSARHGSLFVDPLGFALFGPRLGVEGGAGHFGGAVYGRWFNPGLLAHELFLEDGDSFAFSYGLGARGRYYLGEGLKGAHFGVAAEYLHTRTEHVSSLVATSSAYFVPYAEGGYRLAFGSFYGDLSAGLGYAAQLSGKVVSLPGGSAANLYVASDESSVYGTASLELGIYF